MNKPSRLNKEQLIGRLRELMFRSENLARLLQSQNVPYDRARFLNITNEFRRIHQGGYADSNEMLFLRGRIEALVEELTDLENGYLKTIDAHAGWVKEERDQQAAGASASGAHASNETPKGEPGQPPSTASASTTSAARPAQPGQGAFVDGESPAVSRLAARAVSESSAVRDRAEGR
jgi:hypothetical protein